MIEHKIGSFLYAAGNQIGGWGIIAIILGFGAAFMGVALIGAGKLLLLAK